MDYDDYLTAQGVPQLQSAAPPVVAPPAQDPDAAPSVSSLTVSARPASTPGDGTQPGVNYQAPDLAASARNVKAALADPAFQPQGGSANPGIWGLLPENMQHGTLRNVIGALGDAFLVAGGKAPAYEPRMERQQEGLAFADHAAHPELSNGLMAATGTPDAMKNVVGLQESQNNLDLHRDQLTQQTQYRNDQLALHQQQVVDAQQGRNDNIVARLTPQIGGLASRATDAASYAAAYAQAEKIAQRVGPNYHASDFGLVDPTDWKPGMVQGTTSNQQIVDQAKTQQRGVSVQNTGTRAGATIAAARIGAGQRAATGAAGMGERDAALLTAAAANGGAGLATLAPTDQARVQYLTTKKVGAATPTLIPSAAAAAGTPGGGAQQQFQNNHVYKDKNGNTATYLNGKWIAH